MAMRGSLEGPQGPVNQGRRSGLAEGQALPLESLLQEPQGLRADAVQLLQLRDRNAGAAV